MVKVFLIRHGETVWNDRRLIQGRTNLPLNEAGLLQAEALGRYFEKNPLEILYSSDLIRAHTTAEVIRDHLSTPAPIILDKRLQEIDFGDWEGLTENQVKEKQPEDFEQWKTDMSFSPKNGESISTAAARLKSFIKELHIQYQGKTMGIIAHAGILQAFICQAMEIHPQFWWAFHMYNASISEIWLIDNGASLIRLNYLDHLKDLGIQPSSVEGR